MNLSLLDHWTATEPLARLVIVSLVGLSIASLGIGFERWLALRRLRADVTRDLAAWRASGRDSRQPPVLAATGDGSDQARAATALLVELELVLAARLAPDETARVYDRALRRSLLDLGVGLRRGLATLATIGSVAPFIGLFGTIAGIVNAFEQMARTGQGGLSTVSAGIAEALVTTALGILVAIPALWLYNSLTARVGDLLTELECAGEELAVRHALRHVAQAPSQAGAAEGPRA